jgi:hypothetical protein
MKRTKYLIQILIALTIAVSCKKIVQLPATPHVEFTSFLTFDTTDILGNSAKGGRLKFHFEDGDGDLGLNTPTDSLADTTNLFFTLYRKISGSMVTAPPNDPLTPSSYRIPFMDRQGQNKILKGTISVTFMYLFYNPTDTIKYDFYVEDRALNKSNVASTSEIEIASNKLYTK